MTFAWVHSVQRSEVLTVVQKRTYSPRNTESEQHGWARLLCLAAFLVVGGEL